MAAPVGVVVTISPYRYRGAQAPPPAEGDYLESEGGTTYAVLEARPIDGELDRLHLRCLKLGRDYDYPPDARVYPLEWDSRAPRRGPRRR
jgi:hypothetical protein